MSLNYRHWDLLLPRWRRKLFPGGRSSWGGFRPALPAHRPRRDWPRAQKGPEGWAWLFPGSSFLGLVLSDVERRGSRRHWSCSKIEKTRFQGTKECLENQLTGPRLETNFGVDLLFLELNPGIIVSLPEVVEFSSAWTEDGRLMQDDHLVAIGQQLLQEGHRCHKTIIQSSDKLLGLNTGALKSFRLLTSRAPKHRC